MLNSPPCALTISLAMESPNPVPCVPFFVVKNGCRILCLIASGIPGPLSSISTRIVPFARRVLRASLVYLPGVFALLLLDRLC